MTQVPAAYQPLVDQAAAQTGIPAAVVAAQWDLESGFNPHAVSPTGAEGLTQFEPGTWATYGRGDPFDPNASAAAYSRYMSALLTQEGGDLRKALAAYNAGPANLAAGLGYANTILSRAGTGTTTVAGSTGNLLPTLGPSWAPWNWPADAANAASGAVQSTASTVLSGIGGILVKGAFLILGVGLIGVGVVRLGSAGARKATEPVLDVASRAL